jgi:hypothetical protein
MRATTIRIIDNISHSIYLDVPREIDIEVKKHKPPYNSPPSSFDIASHLAFKEDYNNNLI